MPKRRSIASDIPLVEMPGESSLLFWYEGSHKNASRRTQGSATTGRESAHQDAWQLLPGRQERMGEDMEQAVRRGYLTFCNYKSVKRSVRKGDKFPQRTSNSSGMQSILVSAKNLSAHHKSSKADQQLHLPVTQEARKVHSGILCLSSSSALVATAAFNAFASRATPLREVLLPTRHDGTKDTDLVNFPSAATRQDLQQKRSMMRPALAGQIPQAARASLILAYSQHQMTEMVSCFWRLERLPAGCFHSVSKKDLSGPSHSTGGRLVLQERDIATILATLIVHQPNSATLADVFPPAAVAVVEKERKRRREYNGVRDLPRSKPTKEYNYQTAIMHRVSSALNNSNLYATDDARRPELAAKIAGQYRRHGVHPVNDVPASVNSRSTNSHHTPSRASSSTSPLSACRDLARKRHLHLCGRANPFAGMPVRNAHPTWRNTKHRASN